MLTKRKIKYFLTRIYVLMYGKVSKIKKQILFESYSGRQYSDSPRDISDKMHKLYPEYKLIWALCDTTIEVPDYIDIVQRKSLSYYRALATSLAYVTNENMVPNIHKKKGQFFVQTWHGDRPFKKILYDANPNRDIPVIDNKITDLCVAGSDFGERIYRSAFKYGGEIIKVGMPRNDRLVLTNQYEINNVKKRLNIPLDAKVLLYAPTFRDAKRKSEFEINVDLDKIVKILNRNGDQWLCLVRTHVASRGFQNVGDKVIDVTKYQDMTELLMIADLLITDYSSCAGDFIIRKKPVLLAVFDREEYEKNSRELKVPLEETGFCIAKNQAELENIVFNFQNFNVDENCEKVMKFYGIKETGRSAEEICHRINDFYTNNY